MARDLSNLIPPPVPTDERIEHATEVLARLSQVEGLEGWSVTFHRDNAECTGVYPRDEEPGDLEDFHVEIPGFQAGMVDLGGDLDRHQVRCRLAVRQAIERHDLELDLMRQALESDDARKVTA